MLKSIGGVVRTVSLTSIFAVLSLHISNSATEPYIAALVGTKKLEQQHRDLLKPHIYVIIFTFLPQY